MSILKRFKLIVEQPITGLPELGVLAQALAKAIKLSLLNVVFTKRRKSVSFKLALGGLNVLSLQN